MERTPEKDEILPLEELERPAILRTLRETGGDKLSTARMLGIGKTTLYRELKQYHIGPAEQWRPLTVRQFFRAGRWCVYFTPAVLDDHVPVAGQFPCARTCNQNRMQTTLEPRLPTTELPTWNNFRLARHLDAMACVTDEPGFPQAICRVLATISETPPLFMSRQ